MVNRSLLAALILYLAPAAASADDAHAFLPTTPEGWRSATAQDLTAIHDILRDNSPAMVVSRDSAHFRSWLEQGLTEVREGLPRVTDAAGYHYSMQAYVAGFRDEHIEFDLTGWTLNLDVIAWPGFMVGWRDGGYQVTYRSQEAHDAPAPGARLVSCDGRRAEAVARSHDRYDGNLDLAGVRYFSATQLFVDQGNPFVSRPQVCIFRGEGSDRKVRLAWAPPDLGELRAADRASFGQHSPAKLGLQPWGDGRWWISLPSMTADQDWNGLYDDVRAHLAELRSAEDVVIDVRGNYGGDDGFGDRLARLLWGDAMIDARRPDYGPSILRVTRLNRDQWAQGVQNADGNRQYTDSDRTEFREKLALLDAALARGGQTITLDDDRRAPRRVAGPALMHGRVVILTDYACASACLSFMDETLAMPGVVQAGSTTSADTIFLGQTHVPELPSGLARLSFPQAAWIKRRRGSNVPYSPPKRFTWTGDPGDEAGLRQWLAEALSKP